jgi:hypothetical protein
MSGIFIGYPCSTDTQNLTAAREILVNLGITGDRIYLDCQGNGKARGRINVS